MRSSMVTFPLLVTIACLCDIGDGRGAEVTKTHIDVNTVGNVSLTIAFDLVPDVDREESDRLNQNPSWTLQDDKGARLYEATGVSFSRKSIRFVVDKPSRELLEAMFDPNRNVHLELATAVTAVLENKSAFALQPDVAEALTRGMGAPTPRQRELIQKQRTGDYLMSKDVFDVAKEVDEADTTQAEYVASFRFVRPAFHNYPVLWRAEGRIGTHSENPLNYAEIALRAESPIKSSKAASGRGIVEASYLGDQRFLRTTFNASVGVEAIIPNLIDLTGQTGRLRPKPVITLGASYAVRPSEQELFGGEKTSWEWFAQADYYVPVATKWALSFSGKLRYTDNIEDGNKFRAWNAVSISYDLPLQDLELLAKWESGQHPLVTEQGQQLLIGFLLDRLPF